MTRERMLHLIPFWFFVLMIPFEVLGGTPAPEQFFEGQIVDHLDDGGLHNGKTWRQRYYTWDKEFQGPGYPIFLILGGEGNIEPSTGLYYPFVTHHLAKVFGAYVIEPEHRFYGKSYPVSKELREISMLGEDPRVKLFTSEQALYDALHLVDIVKETLGCSKDRFSTSYCPILTIGGSYPGWLSAMARTVFPHRVDMAYAASAPMCFYSQQVHQYDYYDLITRVAEEGSQGCANAVRSALVQVETAILEGGFDERELGVCKNSTPSYLNPSGDDVEVRMLAEEFMMVVEYTFANANMANYPPSNKTMLYTACQTFLSDEGKVFDKVREFLSSHLPPHGKDCWDFSSQLPSGPNATITSGDWSGVGTGDNGESWDWQTCTLLVEAIGMSKKSMFPPRDWSLDWLTKHCKSRFGVNPKPLELVQRWKFDKLAENNVTRIIFTNGLKDGWSVGGIQQNLSESLIAINFPNGAHHSDLSGKGPTDDDTDDIKQGFRSIIEIVGGWLEDIRVSPAIN